MLRIKRIIERGLTIRLFWDLFMTFAAIANLLLIVFDFSYFFARPYYFEYYRPLVSLYDPVKGVEPHPLTERYTYTADKFFNAEDDQVSEQLQRKRLNELIRMSRVMENENPFTGSGQGSSLQKIYDAMQPKSDGTELSFGDASENFWSYERLQSEDTKRQAELIYEESIRPYLVTNYDRDRELDGTYTDDFLLIDLPFLILFWIEFNVRWLLSIRRKELLRWWLFPLYHWYDVLGLLPVAELRFFRLFRIASIYMRLQRSDLTSIGDDIISRTVKKYSGILTEELSDRVAIRILADMQEEIQNGASLNIVLNALEPRRDQIKDVVFSYTARMAEARPGIEKMRELLGESLEKAARRIPSLQLVPDFIKERLTKEIGIAVFDGINDTLFQNLSGRQGDNAISETVDFILDDMIEQGLDSRMNALFQEITIAVLENMKQAVAVKKWASED